MANKDAESLGLNLPHTGTWGNVSVASATITLAAATIGDVFRFMKLPKDCVLLDINAYNTASSASTTMDFGFTHADGTAGDDPDYFVASPVAISSAALTRKDTTIAPVTLTKDSYITGTLAGANIATGTTIVVFVFYIYKGHA